MKPSTELFKLITSLTKSEKRFYKLTSSLQSGEKNYLKIFDYIEIQESYDEYALKEEFNGQNFIKHLPSEKNHLYRLILKSLRAYYGDYTVSSALKQEIKNVEILYNKALYKECEKFVTRAKQSAKKHEKFYYWYELIGWEKKLIELAYESGVFSLDLDRLVAEEEHVISKLRNLAEYTVIYSKINFVFRSGGFTRNEEERKVVRGIQNCHLIKGENTALSIKAASICYYIKGLCAATNRDYEFAFQYFNKTREILDANPDIKLDTGQRYVNTLFHLLRCHIDNNKFDEAKKMIREILSLKGKKGFNFVNISVRIFANTAYQELTMYNKMGKFNKSAKLLKEVEKKQQKYADNISKEMHVLLTYAKAYSYFGVGNYRESLHYLNQVINDKEQNLRQDIYSFSRIFNVVLHFELRNYEFLEYVVKSTNRYLRRQNRECQIENICAKRIKKLAKTVAYNKRVALLQRMDSEVTELLKNQNECVVLEYFNISAWIKSKLNKVSYKDQIVREHK